jgi:outer membrane protein
MPTVSTRLLTALAAAMSWLSCMPVAAQSTADDGPTWIVGLGAVWNPSPYRNYDNKVWPLPTISYEGKSFYVRGFTAGYKIYSQEEDEISIIASPQGNRFVHGDTEDPQLRLLSDRDISGLAGVAWRHRANWGIVQVSAQKEFTDHGGGSVFDVNYSYPIVHGRLRVVPTVGTAYNSGELNTYYYGISTEEASLSGLPRYRAEGGAFPYLGVAVSYQLSRSWIVSGGFRYTMLPGTIQDSPMVGSDQTESYFGTLSYVF